ncbi:hypothetical protein [Pedobacter sp. Leaf216]|nr:hypothetical protein [Pedobacter sp. Leaf216]
MTAKKQVIAILFASFLIILYISVKSASHSDDLLKISIAPR